MNSPPRPLVRYGQLGWLGCFPAPEAYQRGERVLLRTPRGLEIGEVLVPSLAVGSAPFPDRNAGSGWDGSILRRATPEDQQAAREADQAVRRLLPLLEADSPPWLILDVEATLDRCCILHTLPALAPLEGDPAAWMTIWQERTGWRLEVLDLARFSPPLAASRAAARRLTPAPAARSSACSSGGCSSGCSSGGCSGGGCSSGSCSSGSCGRGAIPGEELYAYFALLREHYPEYLPRHSLL